MNKQAQVGLFTIIGLVAVFAVFFVLADFGTRAAGYKIGVHFLAASGLRNGAIVYLSGVPIGAVDEISLLPDYSTEVHLAIKPSFEIPVNARFLIQAPITGDPSVLIRAARQRRPERRDATTPGAADRATAARHESYVVRGSSRTGARRSPPARRPARLSSRSRSPSCSRNCSRRCTTQTRSRRTRTSRSRASRRKSRR